MTVDNRHQTTCFLFKAQGSSIIELEQIDKNRLVLYTDNNEVFHRFKSWKQLDHCVPYGQSENIIAADLYFSISAKKDLLKVLKNDYK